MIEPSAPPAAACRANLIIDRLINVWLREFQPGVLPGEDDVSLIDVGEARLHAHCLHVSPGGFHRWRLPVSIEGKDGVARPTSAPRVVADLLIDALAQGEDDVVQAMRRRLAQAIVQEEQHASACASRPADLSPQGLEQSLWHGHPFHPFAKSIDGFSVGDMQNFAPERGTSFQLRWIVAKPDICASLWRDESVRLDAQSLLAALSGLPEKAMAGRCLLPVHPWQAERLLRNPVFADLAARGEAILTLPTGALMQATSSVRTVFVSGSAIGSVPDAGIFLKLPIEARITNFARTNPQDHVARGMAASRILNAMRDEIAGCGLDLLDEPGAIWIDHPDLAAITGVILREAPSVDAFVLAGLLEPGAADGRPMAERIGCALSTPDDAVNWLSAHVRTIILPPLRLFARTGISVEAHGQNSLVALDRGLPSRLVVRDLEGVSIDRRRFAAKMPAFDLDPRIVFPSEEAEERLIYHLISNHLNHVVATVARASGLAEARLWRLAADILVVEAGVDEDGETSRLILEDARRRYRRWKSCCASRNFRHGNRDALGAPVKSRFRR